MSLDTTLLWPFLLTPACFFIFWALSATSGSPFTKSLPKLYDKRICLLIAHPDDEAMFFAPTLLALTKPELGNHIKILCLSTGMLLYMTVKIIVAGHTRGKEKNF
jgi:N-acetylglucosaminylphosphatidylinositol deacetylase